MTEPKYLRYQDVLMRPGLQVYCTDRDHPNYDREGTIVAARGSGLHWEFDVKFGPSTLTMSEDQIWPFDTNTEEAREWRALCNLKVFICHRSEDKPAARKLRKQLLDVDMVAWLDEESILPGADWDEAINAAIRSCQAFLVCISKEFASDEGYVQQELKIALERAAEESAPRFAIIPVRLEECELPSSLKSLQWVDFFEPKGRERLRSRLRELAKAHYEAL